MDKTTLQNAALVEEMAAAAAALNTQARELVKAVEVFTLDAGQDGSAAGAAPLLGALASTKPRIATQARSPSTCCGPEPRA